MISIKREKRKGGLDKLATKGKNRNISNNAFLSRGERGEKKKKAL